MKELWEKSIQEISKNVEGIAEEFPGIPFKESLKVFWDELPDDSLEKYLNGIL